ncbi:hypothetical protein V8F20_011949 [Naviculisporaceae sp. PSN 640]
MESNILEDFGLLDNDKNMESNILEDFEPLEWDALNSLSAILADPAKSEEYIAGLVLAPATTSSHLALPGSADNNPVSNSTPTPVISSTAITTPQEDIAPGTADVPEESLGTQLEPNVPTWRYNYNFDIIFGEHIMAVERQLRVMVTEVQSQLCTTDSTLTGAEQRKKAPDVARNIKKSLEEIASFVNINLSRHSLATKVAALNTQCQIFLHVMTGALMNPVNPLAHEIMAEGHMVGWAKYVAEVCDSFTPTDRCHLTKVEPLSAAGDIEKYMLQPPPDNAWLDEFTTIVEFVRREVYLPKGHSADAVDMHRALLMVGGKIPSDDQQQEAGSAGAPIGVNTVH